MGRGLSAQVTKKRVHEMPAFPDWHVIGDWFDNCSCKVACPCTFGQSPDKNLCEFVLFYHIREGHFETVKLDDLCLVRVGYFEGNLWDYEAFVRGGSIIDARASDAQAEAITRIFSGNVGGWPQEFAKCGGRGRESLGSERGAFSFEIAPNQSRWGVDIPGKVKAWANALIGPTSAPDEPPRLSSAPGCEVGPGQIVTWGKSTVCKVNAFGLEFEWNVSSSKHCPFDWRGSDVF
ncbi:DUF1326 domain-containing protein [Roseovarius aestuariivivens]|uniref:DUF1326 domain-containing protein n=1 Tax=Roseovarius aestuariivivens TaxID=1888910 RepID=UPI001081D01D|nr:DUF1326 domain-containing protein [Roseovarius aestuariivivens]